ncbi:cytochrome b N-terminal domain-containing protein [Sporomusa acidovorans]|uniref:Cytochrome b6 n=1 Tax=Sporomusa acidovorans (strain ATCC 49682 / DSM 3132 / Mol) TaxID=1123286 RepID=A0ABZ3JB74_SPOA4|nr:cytochrome b N-terminal domain-containing protein [Sporomusa acidovorans]OZC21778.1 cytochrome b6 [Sporomusa acidovorans DSM 3132]SDD57086.1 cytochrome b6 [Sporomusa acidovorans]
MTVLGFGQKIYGWLDERLGLQSFATQFFKPVPNWVNWLYCFGGITFTVFLFQVLSGAYMSMFFDPSPLGAWNSIEFIEAEARMGHFARALHRWGALLMVLFMSFHMLRIICHGAYRPPRELNWVTGIVLLLLTMAFVVTGYLLPWDFRAYWIALTILNWLDQLPLFAGALRWLLFMETVNGIVPVGRWFAIHVFVLPLLSGCFLAGHFFMVRRQGVAKPM